MAIEDVRASRLGRIGAWCYDHRRRVLAGWILAVIAIAAVAVVAGSRFENDFGASASPSRPRTF
jgi:putative drug exporter of the RND superfamily